MRSVLIRTIAMLLQFILSAMAVHLLSLLIGQLLEAYPYRRAAQPSLGRCRPPEVPDQNRQLAFPLRTLRTEDTTDPGGPS